MIVDCAVYEDGRRRSGDLALQQAYEACRDPDAWVWIGLHEPTREEFDSVRREFDLHELAVEDAIKAHQRPKLEAYDDSLFLVLKTVRYIDSEEVLEFGEIHLFVGAGFIVSVRHGEARELHSLRQEVEGKPELLRLGPGAVLHAIMDRIVDDYLAVVPALENDVDEVEEQVFSPGRLNPAERIFKLKREVLEFHRATAPLLEPLDAIVRGRYELIHEDVHAYFRDVLDHLRRIVDQVEGFRDLLTSVLDANLAQVSVRQNEDVRKISAWVAIIAVPTMIAGIYGMNFEHMPELKWTFGYPLAVAVMLVLCASLYRYFKKSGWL
jgi:magnesium transporter